MLIVALMGLHALHTTVVAHVLIIYAAVIAPTSMTIRNHHDVDLRRDGRGFKRTTFPRVLVS